MVERAGDTHMNYILTLLGSNNRIVSTVVYIILGIAALFIILFVVSLIIKLVRMFDKNASHKEKTDEEQIFGE